MANWALGFTTIPYTKERYIVDAYDLIKAELDKQLAGASPSAGIAFGTELFNEFRKRGWFTLEVFSVLGTSLFPDRVPAYNKTHFVFPSWGIQDVEFKVGKSQ